MGMGTHQGGGRSGRGRRRQRARPVSEINVTPLVDVMLVLLIVFMVAAPLSTAGIPLQLPKSAAKALNTQAEPLTVSITQQGDIYVLKDKVELADLINVVADQASAGTEERIYIRADNVASYGTVIKVMGALSGAGYAKIALLSEQEQGS